MTAWYCPNIGMRRPARNMQMARQEAFDVLSKRQMSVTTVDIDRYAAEMMADDLDKDSPLTGQSAAKIHG